VVGVGASAGGLDAFRQLLKALPADTGLAYVFVQHLDPRHESVLAELLSKSTSMPVAEVKGDVRVEANRVYILPPSRDIVLAEGTLKLVPRTKTGGQHMPIDYFLRTLAAVQGARSIGVILSGMASDGTLGLKAIKAEGGIAFAQDPDSAQADGMPRSAIDAGCVDFVLPPAGIAEELARLGRHPYVTREAPAGPGEIVAAGQSDKAGLSEILALLRKATGTDFTGYKQTTIRRRIARRMAVNRSDTFAEYARRLEGSPAEVQALYQDCLICVTSFFRDPETFRALSEQVFPRLLKDRPPEAPLRIWVAGCATGEEAYSLAICLLERAGERATGPGLQVFATDLSEKALEVARAGKYLENIVQDVSPERLRRFFTKVDGRYQVSKTIREMCVFARHDLGRDPAFSRMDLITCRNVLIYLEAHRQEKVLASFHYALKPTGYLVLGASETVGASALLFDPVDKKHRIYSRKATTPHPALLFSAAAAPAASETLPPRGWIAKKAVRGEVPREADRILLARYAPAGVVVDHDLNILEFRGDTDPYLEHGRLGQASLNLMKMVRRGLLLRLRQAVQAARETDGPVRKEGVQFKHHASLWKANLEVIPIKEVEAEGCLLVLFEGSAVADFPEEEVPKAPESVSVGARDLELARLRQELTETKHYLQAVVQEHEATTEELQSTNEEAMSANEELQSVNEEMVTAKEELQSGNEELATLNQELQDRNAQLAQLNDDLTNAFGSVDLPIVMVGSDLRLRRFTPAAEKLLKLVPADLGRPLGDIRPDLDVPDLTQEVRQVIDTASVADREVKDRHGRSYKLRISPYRTQENRVEGAVLALVDVDALKRSAERVQQALEYASAIVETVVEPLLVLDSQLRIEKANRAFYEDFHVSPEETEGKLLFELGSGQWDIPALRTALTRVLSKERPFEAFEVDHEFPGVGPRTMALNARRLRYERSDGAERILLALQDRTEVSRAEADRERLLLLEHTAREKAESADRLKDEFVATVSHELRGPLSAMAGWIHVLRGELPLDAATTSRGLAAIDRGVRAQTRLIEDLLDHSRIAAGKLQLSYGIVDLRAIAQSVLDSVRAGAEAKGITLELTRGDTAAVIVADADRMQQVVWNLVSNAVKFTPPGGRVEVSIGRVGRHFQLAVSDTGQGIPPEFLPYVFDRFRQAEGSRARTQPGLGLGLAIVRQLVELHGGSVTAESRGEGQGSTFTIELPIPALLIEPDAADDVRPGIDLPAPVEPRGGPDQAILDGLRVLVADDEVDARDALVTVLERYGAKVTAAASAAEAMEALRRGVPDVLVSDIGMPGEDGYELMRKVRKLAPEEGGRLPALALTAYAGDDDRSQASLAGYQAYLTKPVSPAELVATVARMAERHGPRGAPPTGGHAVPAWGRRADDRAKAASAAAAPSVARKRAPPRRRPRA
jgi:two-component system CheB/CheR fusion protein